MNKIFYFGNIVCGRKRQKSIVAIFYGKFERKNHRHQHEKECHKSAQNQRFIATPEKFGCTRKTTPAKR